ncbi:hypothetical protein [Biostraticola tofi]|nr:hypothetical protein [Biostraticola tofi]
MLTRLIQPGQSPASAGLLTPGFQRQASIAGLAALRYRQAELF